jgi:phage shock protein C
MLLPPPAGAPQRLLRSARDRRIGGVCGGFAEYFGTDPTLVRLLAVIATIFSGFFMGIFAYILCWIVIPKAQWWWTPAASPPAPPAPMSAAGPAPAPAA